MPIGLFIVNALIISPYGSIGDGYMITNAKEFGNALRQRRKDLGYTQAYLSDFSGFSVTFISDLENGKSTAELGKSIYLATLLGLDLTMTSRS